jgi:hypothetical protein
MGKHARRALKMAALGGSVGPVPKSNKITGEFRNPEERPHGQPYLRPWYMSPRKAEEAAGTQREDTRPPIVPRVHSIARRADGGGVSEFDNLDPITREAVRLTARGTRDPRQMAANAKINRDAVLDNLPVIGNVRAAGRAIDAGGELVTAAHYGHGKKKRRAALTMALEAVGALSPLPWGRRAGEAARTGKDTANVFVPAQPSKTADLAREMRGNDVPNRDIFRQTNRFFGPDGRLRAEVPDKPMNIRRTDMQPGDSAPMGDVIDHPALFGVHPEMRDIPVKFTDPTNARGHPIARTHREGGFEVSAGRDEHFYREQMAKLLNYQAGQQGGFGGAVLHDIHDQFKAYDDALRMAEDIVRNPKPGDNVTAALAYIERLQPMRQQLAEGVDAAGAVRNVARRGGASGVDEAMEVSRLRGVTEDAARAANRSTTGNLESRLVRSRAHRDVGGGKGSLSRYPYEQGVRLGEVGENWSKAQVLPGRGMDRDDTARMIDDWHNYGIGNPRKFANGGRAKRVERALRKAGGVTVGAVAGATPGRADALKVRVPAGSYVVPADVVAALGEGNSAAGLAKLGKQFPAGGRANGGSVPIQISDGEFVVSPQAIAALGGGDAEYGHAIMDAFVLQTRKEHITHLSSLPGPNQ